MKHMKKTLKTKEGKKMRKILLTMFLVLISVILLYGNANALSGKCGSCHVMHASQDGSASTPNDNLTKYDCIGCHLNGLIAAAPNVFGTATRVAGGTFASSVVDTAATDYHKVHNVRDITWTNDETELLNITPGAETAGYTEPAGANELTCAGTLGCHGNHDGTGLNGFHHNAYPNAYRFLRFYDGGAHTDIQGKGSSDCELGGAAAGDHNVYYALNDDSDAARDSISSFCSLCHGDFHDQGDTTDGGSSPWKRHPTEIMIPVAWNVAGVTIDYENTPFGFSGGDYTTMTTSTPYAADLSDSPRVVCLSCHRAHGSDYDDILRFDYTINANAGAGLGGTTGCLACHSLQR
jgi:hypothetical protein